MDFPDEVISNYRKYLQALDYPNITNYNETETKTIFTSENRIFLLTWIFSKLIADYIPQLEKAKQNGKIVLLLSKIVYTNGFCSSQEKGDFVSSPSKIACKQQVVIFNRIFNLLKFAYRNTEDKENICVRNSKWINPIDVIAKVEKLASVNIFPEYAPFKHLSSDERSKRVEDYKKTIEDLNDQICMAKDKKENLSKYIQGRDTDKVAFDDIQEKFTKLRSLLNVFAEQYRYINVDTNATDDENRIKQFGENVKESSEHLKMVLKILESKLYIKKFIHSDENNQVNKSLNEDDIFIQQSCLLSKEVLEKYKLEQ